MQTRTAIFPAVSALALSSAIVLPCLWLPLSSPGDIQSHLYNAWLATLIAKGDAPGLSIQHQISNVLADYPFVWLLNRWGPAVAERVVTSWAVLTFFWGAFAYVSAVYRRRAYQAIPWLAILAYGYVFQVGLLNYYISTGLILGAMALLERRIAVRTAAPAGAMVAVAAVAHPAPVAWLAARGFYRRVARQLSGKALLTWFTLSAAGLLTVSWYVRAHYLHVWGAEQLTFILGADQMLLYGWRYTAVAALFAGLLLVLFIRTSARWTLAKSIDAQVYALTALAIATLPSFFRDSVHSAWIGFLAERLSLVAAVLLLALLGRGRAHRLMLGLGGVAGTVFFALLWLDVSGAARLERNIEHLVMELPRGQRVVLNLDPPPTNNSTKDQSAVERLLSRPLTRISLTHLLSRACIGRCFDYMNYEPATAQFRIRAEPGNSIVASDIGEVYAMEIGWYRLRGSDPPLYGIFRCDSGPDDLCLRELAVGQSIRDLKNGSAISRR